MQLPSVPDTELCLLRALADGPDGNKILDAAGNDSAFSPRSGRQRRAWGVSPRIELGKVSQARGGTNIILPPNVAALATTSTGATLLS